MSKAFACDRRAATAVEYGLILSLIVIGLFAAVGGLGGKNLSIWTSILNAVTAAH